MAGTFSPSPPDAFDPLVIHDPTCIPQQLGNLAIAVAPILTSKFDDVGGQLLFIFSPGRNAPLR